MELQRHPDRLRWNARYAEGAPSFAAHGLSVRALALDLPDGPVLDLACGPSGAALLAAAQGRPVTAVDISEVALDLLDGEARRRGLRDLITLVQADLGVWRPARDGFAAVLCTGFWHREVFAGALPGVRAGGALAWEGFTVEARVSRPHLPAEWCMEPGEPASLLPGGFTVLARREAPDSAKRGLLARRSA